MINTQSKLYSSKLEKMPAKIEARIVRYFADTHLGNGHNGLAKLAKKNGIDMEDLSWGEFLVFMNSRQNMLKMFTRGGMIAHLRMPGGAKIDPRTIPLLPRFFSGGELRYDRAIEAVIRKEFGK